MSDTVLIYEARGEVANVLSTGEKYICPCCDKNVHADKRSVYATPARQLVQAFTRFGHDPFYIGDIVSKAGKTGGGDFAKLRYWSLIAHENDRNNGWWRVTRKGGKFIMGYTDIIKYCYTYNAKIVRWGDRDDRVTFVECLGKDFDLNEILLWGEVA